MGRWIIILLYFSLFLALQGCNFNPTASEEDSIIGDNYDGLQRLNSVSGITLVTPSSSPDILTTPTIRISGLKSLDTVYVYSDSSCSSLLATGTSTGSSVDITLPALSAGTHTIYAKRRWPSANIESDCSALFLSYEVLEGLGLSLQAPAATPDVDTTPTIRVSGVNNGETVSLFTDSGCSTQVGSSVATGTTVDITTSALSEGSYTLYARSTNPNNSACSTASVSYAVCPTGYIGVPENTGLGVNGFCVMKYEARDIGGVPDSQAFGTLPWVDISHSDAWDECDSLTGGSGTYAMISNPEWMTIARNIENVATNWSGGSVGDGMLSIGHSDSAPDNAIIVISDSDPYDGTGNSAGSGWEQKRTFTLSNGEVIWDFAGNLWERVDWDKDDVGLTLGPSCTLGPWVELIDASGYCPALTAADYMPANPADVTPADYDSNYGLGRFQSYSDPLATQRSGGWNSQAINGIGAFTLLFAASAARPHVGFRCVYRP